ncbi:MAG: hypothetical protein K2G42_07420 [Clostridia bacterium]|nr:hypothetical protein [Clostridia bacterium]
MDMDFAKMMQMMNSMNGGGGNKDMAMLMQLLPTMMNGGNAKPAQPTQITLNADEVNKSIFKLYQDQQ